MSARVVRSARSANNNKTSNDRIPDVIGTVVADVNVIKHRQTKEGIFLDVEVLVNGLIFERTYFVNKCLNQNEMIDFITIKIKEEQDNVLVPTFKVTL